MMCDAIEGVKPIRRKFLGESERVYCYQRATGHRLPDDPTSPAFKLALEKATREAAAEAAPAEVDTVETLIRRYQAAPKWTKLVASTREIEQFKIKAIEREFGSPPLAGVERKGARAIFLE